MENILFTTTWATMPLNEEELLKVPVGHQERPYLIILEKKEHYYAFPCTSNVFGNNSRYENSKLLLRGQRTQNGKSLALLERVYLLPKDNLIYEDEIEYELTPKEINELLKKLKANIKFSNYPQEVIEFITKIPTTFTINDLILHNDRLYIIIGDTKDHNGYYCFSVSNAPFNKSIEVIADTNKYYVNVNEVHHIIPNETTEYKSIISGFALPEISKGENIKVCLSNLKKYLTLSPRFKKVSSEYKENQHIAFKDLQPGTVISYIEDDIKKKMVILKKDSNNQIVLDGLENQMYKDYTVCYFPVDFTFDFKIENTLCDERVETLINKRLQSEEKRLQYIW